MWCRCLWFCLFDCPDGRWRWKWGQWCKFAEDHTGNKCLSCDLYRLKIAPSIIFKKTFQQERRRTMPLTRRDSPSYLRLPFFPLSSLAVSRPSVSLSSLFVCRSLLFHSPIWQRNVLWISCIMCISNEDASNLTQIRSIQTCTHTNNHRRKLISKYMYRQLHKHTHT